MKKSLSTRSAAALILGGALALGGALSANAHVTVSPDAAPAGSTALLTFTVPNESATARTDRVEINLPPATPFADVTWVPTPGWSAKLVTTKLAQPVKLDGEEILEAVTQVVFTADAGGALREGESQTFSIRVEGVPDVGTVAITASQHYNDGKVVEWADTSANAEDPAPQLFVNDAAPGAGATPGASVAPGAATEAAGASGGTVDPLARVLGALGLVAGAIGIAVGAIARRRAMRP